MKMDVCGITMIYSSGKIALDNISIQMESPGLIGILGPNGAGKTTLIKLLITALVPTRGEIILDGKPLLSQEKRLKSQLGYLPQSFGLYDDLTVWQFIDYMAALKGTQNKAAIDEVLELAGLAGHRKVHIRNLSGGQRQRVGIAQALIGNPHLLILDEPTVGLDPEERVKFRNIFSEMSMSSEKIVILSTHIVEDVQSICNRVLVLYHGQILFDGKPACLIAEALGHVGVFVSDDAASAGCQVVSKVNTTRGIQCRVIAHELPDFAEPAEPTLEDAYLYCIRKQQGISVT